MAYGLISGQSMVLPTLTNPAQPNQLLTGTQLIDQDREIVNGTMPNRGTITRTLTQQGQQYTIPQGYHSGSGKITANFSNLTAGNIRDGVNIGGVVGTYNGEVGLELVDTVTIPAGRKTVGVGYTTITLSDISFNTSGNKIDLITWNNITFNISMNNTNIEYSNSNIGTGYNNLIANSANFGSLGSVAINIPSTDYYYKGTAYFQLTKTPAGIIQIETYIRRNSGSISTSITVSYTEMIFYAYSIIQ